LVHCPVGDDHAVAARRVSAGTAEDALKPVALALEVAVAKITSIFDIPLDQTEAARLDAAAHDEIAAGQGVPHERVREWLLKLKAGESGPPPVA
jgi:hypothetical protein